MLGLKGIKPTAIYPYSSQLNSERVNVQPFSASWRIVLLLENPGFVGASDFPDASGNALAAY